MNMIESISYWIDLLLGGRPMKYENYAFTDVVSGERVNRYTDKFGRKWLANNKWSWFRVKRR